MRRVLLAAVSSVACVSLLTAHPGGPSQDKPLTCADLRVTKSKVYGFHPAQMTEAEIAAKGKELDEFWEPVQAAGPLGASCLKEMLAAEKTDHSFQFDAGEVLYQLDRSPEVLSLIRDSITQADFQETDPANYLSLSLALALAGVDIQPLAAKLLRYPNAAIHISEHSLDLDADTSALFLYGAMPTAQASKALVSELQAPEPFVRAAAAHLLAEQMTEEAFAALSKWNGLGKIEEDYRRNDIQAILKYQLPNAADFANPKFTREQVLKTIARLPHTQKEFEDAMSTRGAAFDKQMREKKLSQAQLSQAVAESEPIYGIAGHSAFLSSAVATLQSEDFEGLREARRKSLFNVSDESLDEYLAFTQIMIGMLNRLDLYKEYRAH